MHVTVRRGGVRFGGEGLGVRKGLWLRLGSVLECVLGDHFPSVRFNVKTVRSLSTGILTCVGMLL